MGIFSPEQREKMYEAGEVIGSVIQDRYDTKQAENFVQNELATYFARATEFTNSLGTFETGDQMAQAHMQFQQDTMAWTAAATAKYGNNARIQTIVQEILAKNMEGMDEYIKTEAYGEERGKRGQMEEERLEERERAGRKAEADIGFRGAETERSEASAAESRARAGLLTAQAGAVGEEAAGAKFPTIPAGTGLGEARQALKNALVNKDFGPMIQSKVAQGEQAAIHRMVQGRMGQEKANGRLWGDKPEEDLAQATSEWAAHPLRQKTIEALGLRAMGYDIHDASVGGYFDDLGSFVEGGPLPGDRTRKIRPGATDRHVLTRILGMPNSKAMIARGMELEFKPFIEDTLDETPQSVQGYRSLGPLVRNVLENTVITDEHNKPVLAADHTPVTTYPQLVKKLNDAWRIFVVERNLDPDAYTAVTNTQNLGKEIIKKYAPVIAPKLGIPVPKSLETKYTGILGAAVETAKLTSSFLTEALGFGEEIIEAE